MNVGDDEYIFQFAVYGYIDTYRRSFVSISRPVFLPHEYVKIATLLIEYFTLVSAHFDF